MRKVPFRLETTRATCAVTFGCFADPALFQPVRFQELPKKVQNEFNKNGSIPCEGGGMPGEWCMGCRFGGEIDREDDP